MMILNRDAELLSQLFYQKIIFAKRWASERVMKLNCFRINCIIEKLYSSCYWFSDIFSSYDSFETCSFIRDYKTSIRVAILTWLFSSQLFYQMNCIYRTLNVSWCWYDCSSQLYHQKNCIVVLLIFRYVFVIWFDLNLLHDLFATCLYLWLFFCQCRCLVTDAWILDVCFQLTKFF